MKMGRNTSIIIVLILLIGSVFWGAMNFGINTTIFLLIECAFLGVFIYIVVLVVKALKKYLNSSERRKENKR